MKSAIAAAALAIAGISLQGCGGDGTTTTPDPGGCTYDSTAMWECPTTLSATFQDIHDGDSKNVTIENGVMTISGSNWHTSLNLDPRTCIGSVDFNVPNKTNPPPTNLTLALMSSFASESSCNSPSTYVLSFSGPGDTTMLPLNQWVEQGGSNQIGTNFTCFPEDQAARTWFYADMGDGDQKVVVTDCSGTADTCSLTITPKTTAENWTIHGQVSKSNCSGMVNFDVPGKPNPPPFPLLATFRVSRWFSQPIMLKVDLNPAEYFIEWSHDGSQLNQWAEVHNQDVLPTGLPTTAAPTGTTTGAPTTTGGPTTTPAAPGTATTTAAPTTTGAPTPGPGTTTTAAAGIILA